MDIKKNAEPDETFTLEQEKKVDKIKKQKKFYQNSIYLCGKIFLDKLDGRLGEA